MRAHHTKNKGDLGLFQAQLDLVKKGYGILHPMTEHEAFDLVAYKGNEFTRIQVKYRRAVGGVIGVPFRSSWADKHGAHSIYMDKTAVDLVCVYCPDTDRCYYLAPHLFGVFVNLRLEETRNGQSKRVWYAKDFLDIPRPLSSVGLEHTPSKGRAAGSNPAGAATDSNERPRHEDD